MSETDHTEIRGWTQVLMKDMRFLHLIRHP